MSNLSSGVHCKRVPGFVDRRRRQWRAAIGAQTSTWHRRGNATKHARSERGKAAAILGDRITGREAATQHDRPIALITRNSINPLGIHRTQIGPAQIEKSYIAVLCRTWCSIDAEIYDTRGEADAIRRPRGGDLHLVGL